MKLFIHVKFRAFGVTFGTVQQEMDFVSPLLVILKHILPPQTAKLVDTVPLNFGPLPQPLKVWDKNGVYVEVR